MTERTISEALQRRMREMPEGQVDDRRRANRAQEAGRRRSPGRNSSSDVIRFPDVSEDDSLVRMLKQAINGASITLDEVYAAVGHRGTGWNLYYGLLTRHTTTMKTFAAWAGILGFAPEIRLVAEDGAASFTTEAN